MTEEETWTNQGSPSKKNSQVINSTREEDKMHTTITLVIAVLSMGTFDCILVYKETGSRKTMYTLLLILCDVLVIFITKFVAARENRSLFMRKRRYVIVKWSLFVLSLDTKTLAIVANISTFCQASKRNEIGKCLLSPITSKIMTFCYTLTFCALFLQLLSSKFIVSIKRSSSPTRFAVSSLMVLINLCDAIELKSILWRSEEEVLSFTLAIIHFTFSCCILMAIPTYFFANLPKFNYVQTHHPPVERFRDQSLLSVLGGSKDVCFTNLVTMAARFTLIVYDSSLPVSMSMLAKNLIMLSVALINLVENIGSERSAASASASMKQHKILRRVHGRSASMSRETGPASFYSLKNSLTGDNSGNGVSFQCRTCSNHFDTKTTNKAFLQEQEGSSKTIVSRSVSLPLQQSNSTSTTSSLDDISSSEGEPLEYVNEQL